MIRSLPEDTLRIVDSFLIPHLEKEIRQLDRATVQAAALVFSELALVNKAAKTHYQPELDKLKVLRDQAVLIRKYSQGNGSPLIDALLTNFVGYSNQYSLKEYNPEVEADIRAIVRLFPNTINEHIGYLRLVHYISPLTIACCNANITLETVEFLLQSGANPNAVCEFNASPAPLLSIIQPSYSRISHQRFINIKALLKKYGAQDLESFTSLTESEWLQKAQELDPEYASIVANRPTIFKKRQ